MRVNTHYLKEGCIISADIKGLSGNPIMSQKTILNEELIEVLHAFRITEANVEKVMINGQPFSPAELADNEKESFTEERPFLSNYLTAVQAYKQQFQNWQAGSAVDAVKVREMIIPLLEQVLEQPSHLFQLHHYCTKDDYLYHHAISTGLLSGYIANKMKFTQSDVFQVALGGTLVDCGMAKVSPGILNKRTNLSSEEFDEVRKHPVNSVRMLGNSPIIKETIKFAILQHHERLDGSGYPVGKKGKKPHTFSRILAVADVFHAMTSERNYRKKQSPFKVMEQIMKDHFGKFDIQVINCLLEGLANYAVGSKVKLSNGSIAEIIFVNAGEQTRPLVKISETGEMLSLSQHMDLHIEEII